MICAGGCGRDDEDVNHDVHDTYCNSQHYGLCDCFVHYYCFACCPRCKADKEKVSFLYNRQEPLDEEPL